MKTLIFILLINSHEHCTSRLLDSPMGQACEDAKFEYYNTYVVNSKPCWDEGMNKEISESELRKHPVVYKVIVDPQGGIAYCPKKSRMVRFTP